MSVTVKREPVLKEKELIDRLLRDLEKRGFRPLGIGGTFDIYILEQRRFVEVKFSVDYIIEPDKLQELIWDERRKTKRKIIISRRYYSQKPLTYEEMLDKLCNALILAERQ
jgi:hypothetical protein